MHVIRISLVTLLLAGAGRLAAQDSGPLSDLAFMAGCWRGEYAPGRVIEEFYSEPSENLIVGTTRYLRDGRAVQFEFARITVDSGRVVLLPYPGGRPSEHGFVMTHVVPGQEVVFEAPEHDYPKRIVYFTDAAATRTAQIDAGPDDPEPRSWSMRRVEC